MKTTGTKSQDEIDWNHLNDMENNWITFPRLGLRPPPKNHELYIFHLFNKASVQFITVTDDMRLLWRPDKGQKSSL